MRTRSLVLALLAAAVAGLFVACGSSGESASSGGGGTETPSGGGGGTGTGTGEGSGETPAAPAHGGTGDRPAQAADLRMQLEMLDVAHLADIDHEGLYMDFGSPARAKYTMGAWRSGWGADGVDGDETYTYASETGRVYFTLTGEPGPLTVRLRMRAVGSRRLQVFVNNQTLPEGIELAEAAEFRDYDVSVPASMVRRGENMLLLRFGGTTQVDGHNVSVAMSTIRVISGTPAASDHFVGPDYDTLVARMELDGTTRRALAVRAPTTVSYYVDVPEHAHFVFGVGGEGTSGSATAHVSATPEGGTASEIWTGPIASLWNDQSIDLASFAGQVVRLDLRVEGTWEGRIGWAVPAIMVDPPQVATAGDPVRNVVVILIDTLRASKLRAYNPQSRVQTPVFDRLAQHGTLFARAQSEENWTKPSVASVLTGLTPATHGCKTDAARLPDSAEMVSEAFDAAGFATGSFIANGYVSDRFGFDQGWDYYTNFIREERSTHAEDVYRAAGDFIEQHHDERFFVYVQTIDPHVPYDPPVEYLRMYDPRTDYVGQVQPRLTADLLERAKRTPPQVTFNPSDITRLTALHDGDITYHDHEMGEFLARLEQLGVADDTLFVITADHGEEFQDHGSWGHGHSVYQELLHVPLLFYRPGHIPEGHRIERTVSTMFISQSVVDAAGIPGMTHAEGRSLMPDIRGEVPTGYQVAFSDMLDDRRVIRAGRWKMIMNGNNTKMFDLQEDPREEHEVTDMTHWPVAQRYCRILLGQYLGAQDRGHWWSASQHAAGSLHTEDAQVDETLRAQLRALGYAN
jgi:arylsulfatase A-like enzyme